MWFFVADVAAPSFHFLRDERPFYTPNTVPLTYFAASRRSELPVTVENRPTRPSRMKTIQNIFFSMGTIVVAGQVSTRNSVRGR